MTNEYIHSIELEGQVATRKSYREYTHVVVGRVDIARLRSRMATATQTDRQTAEYYAQQVLGTGRDALQAQTGGLSVNIGKTNQQIAIEDGWTNDGAANLKRLIEHRVAVIDKQISEGTGTLQVLQWSMSEKSARSGMRTFANRHYHIDLAVLPVASRVPATKRQMA